MKTWILLLITVGIGTGCGGKYLPPYLPEHTDQRAVRADQTGLSITAVPLMDRRSCRAYFGMACLEKGILPIHLTASNTNSNTVCRIVTTDMWFDVGPEQDQRVPAGLSETNQTAAGSAQAVAGGVMAGLSPVLGVVLLGAGMKATDDAESIRENFTIKQFQNVTLAPGKSASGFVYYRQAGPISNSLLPSLHIPVRDLSANRTNTLSLVLSDRR